MSFSSQILTFLGVSAVYIGFTFAWAWYKGKQEEDEPNEPQRTAETSGGEH